MNIEISKELLCAILDKEVTKWDEDYIKDNVIEIGINLPSGGRLYKQVNIYELADKTIDWIESKDFCILNTEINIYRLFKRGEEVYSIDTQTRLHVPFMCGQWILDNQK